MWRHSFDGFRFDIFAFIGRNRFKFLLAFLLAAAGFVFGLINAFARVTTEDALLAVKNYGIVRLSLGERSFFGYWMGRFFLHFLLIAVITLLGVRELLAYLSYLVLVIYAYQYAFLIGAVFCYAGLAALPVMLACLIPLFIIFMCILLYFSVFILCFSRASRVEALRDFSYYAHSVKAPLCLASGIIFAVSLIESVLAALLTSGIVL